MATTKLGQQKAFRRTSALINPVPVRRWMATWIQSCRKSVGYRVGKRYRVTFRHGCVPKVVTLWDFLSNMIYILYIDAHKYCQTGRLKYDNRKVLGTCNRVCHLAFPRTFGGHLWQWVPMFLKIGHIWCMSYRNRFLFKKNPYFLFYYRTETILWRKKHCGNKHEQKDLQ